MGVTIKEIAEEAGVSIATVSHALNKTRYVSPEISDRVLAIARKKGYKAKHEVSEKNRKYKLGKMSEIALVIPNTFSVVYTRLIAVLSKLVDEEGYTLSIYLSDGESEQERHILNEIISNRRIAGVILCPANAGRKHYQKLMNCGRPFVCLERMIEGEEADAVISDNVQGLRTGTEHLIKCGHERIALLLEDKTLSTVKERREGYLQALREYDVPCDEELIACVGLEDGEEAKESIKAFIKKMSPTAILAGGNTLTLRCLKAMGEMGMECPKDISIVGFGDDKWCDLITPALTTLIQDTEEIGRKTVHLLLNKIEGVTQERCAAQKIVVPMELSVRKSTLNIARGPFGEKVVYPEENFLSEEELEVLKNGNYTVGISFHYTGNEWTRLHEKAIKDTLSNMGVRVLSVTDANFDPDLQNTQLEGLIMQHPDAIIAVPTDEVKTAAKFKELAGQTKLILINNMPNSLGKDEYSCWLSVNERENGQNAARILREHFHGQENVKVGMLVHGAPFFATKQRDFFAEQTFLEDGSNIRVVSKRSFYQIDNAYEVCRRMIQDHPDIQGLYITWDRPALQAIRALDDLGREDIAITTTDLDYEIAACLAKGRYVVGLSSQRPYDQGIAVATATARALLGKCEHKCIGVPPYTVMAGNLDKAWKEILKTKMPEFEPAIPPQATGYPSRS